MLATLDSATYSWPCENTGSFKKTPTFAKVAPCALLMVIANADRIGNCTLLYQ